MEAIKFLENYIASAHTEDSPFKEISAKELTINARSCMDKLIVYCDNAEIVEIFDSIILKGESMKSDEYIKRFKNFRILCREELGLKKVKFQNDVFYWLVTTNRIRE